MLAAAAGLIFLFGGMVICFGKALATEPTDWRWASIGLIFAAVFVIPMAVKIGLTP